MQIAKLFGSLGFKVDTTGLDDFAKAMKTVRSQVNKFKKEAIDADESIKMINSSLKSLKRHLTLRMSAKDLRGEFSTLSTQVEKTAKAFKSIENRKNNINFALTSIQSKVSNSVPIWKQYREEVERTALALTTIRSGSLPRVNLGTNNYSNNPRMSGNQNSVSHLSAVGLAGLTGGSIFGMARQAILGGIATAIPFAVGTGVKEVISSGREMRSADQVLLAHSDNQRDFEGNSAFIKDLANRNGTDIIEATKGFGRVLSASKAGGGTTKQAQEVFTNFSNYATTMHLGQDEQARLIKALEQTYTNGRILGGEINQFANVGIPMKAVLKELSQGHSGGNSKDLVPEWVKKLAGSKAPDTVKLMPYISQFLNNVAMNNGAYAKSLDSSQAQQGRMKNVWTEFSTKVMEGGGDKALSDFFKILIQGIKVINKTYDGLMLLSDSFDKLGGVFKYLAWIGTIVALRFATIGGVLRGTASMARLLLAPITALRWSFAILFGGGGRLTGVMLRLGLATATVTRSLGFLSGLRGFGAISGLMGGLLGKLLKIGGRLFWIISLFQILGEVKDAQDDQEKGMVTWIDDACASMDILIAKTKLYWAIVTNPIKAYDYYNPKNAQQLEDEAKARKQMEIGNYYRDNESIFKQLLLGFNNYDTIVKEKQRFYDEHNPSGGLSGQQKYPNVFEASAPIIINLPNGQQATQNIRIPLQSPQAPR